ncbi:MAG: SPOR domain-containing protein [Gammaproteobacteria bacterium]|nr:SPOR domain-containing protein [Gammaproteobacteria bacterium]MBU1623464.1 SPOR domain-containing protein [Gammaproteobacteria bacterium]MBU1982303.1 SPOR domain-containing protein [Gammaproteobacteria bacterium]
MSKKWVWGLLLANALLFSWMRWGVMLTADPDALAAQADVNAGQIVLLNEVPPPKPEQLLLPVVVPEPAPVAASTVAAAEPAPAPRLSDALANPPKIKQCLYWGEFSGSGLADAEQKLSTLNLGEQLQTQTIEHASGFWVYMSPLRNQAAVHRKIGQLKALGVNDYFVVLEGEWQRAISLGVFRTERAAENHLASLRKQGVRTAKVGERKSKLRFTQFVILDAGTEIESKVRGFQKELPDSELKMSDCN